MGMKKIILFSLLLVQLAAISQQKKYKVIAYYTGNGETIQQYPVKELTHIIYSFLKLQNDTLTFVNDNQRKIVEQLVALKKENPSLKIMVSLGGWGGCAPCSELFSSAVHRSNFAKTTVALFKQYNIDGLDLDWEYPTIEGYPGHRYDSEDKANFTELIFALRKEMGSKFLLSFAAGGFDNFLEKSVDWDAIMPQLDFVNLMTYDLVGGYSKVTGHHTPLAGYMPGQQSTQNCVNWLLKHNVAADKLIIGAAFYARVWAEVEAGSNNGLYQSGTFLQGVDYKNFATYFNQQSGFTYHWDEKANAPWQYNKTKKLFATFDDEKSIAAKTNFIRENKLGGIMFWELSLDKGQSGLVDVITKGLAK
jgi:chitinase